MNEDAVTEDWHAVGVAINSRMAELRMTQRELSDRSGISVATLRLLQQGARKATNKTLESVSQALDLPDDHLVSILLGARASRRIKPVPSGDLASIRQELKDVTGRLEKLEKTLAQHGLELAE